MTSETSYSNYFNDVEQVKSYAEAPSKFMPGYDAMHQMVSVLLDEYVPPNGNILVHGAGGGLETESFAEFNKAWKFLGVDPAEPMLDEARKRLEPIKDRVSLHRGFIFDAPDIELDAATSLLTLHFLGRDDRRETVTEIVRRLKPGAPFIAVHCSFPQGEKNVWLTRHRRYSIASGIDPETAEAGRANIETELPVLNPEEDVAILNAAGLKNVRQFYSAFTWRGWVGYA